LNARWNADASAKPNLVDQVTGKTTLEIRGYLGIALLGQSQTWTRAD